VSTPGTGCKWSASRWDNHARPPILIAIDADPVPTTVFGDTAGLLPYSVLIGRDGRILEAKLGALDPATIKDWLAEANASKS